LFFDVKNFRDNGNDQRIPLTPRRLRSIYHAIRAYALHLRMRPPQLLLENFVVRVNPFGDADAAGYNRYGARM
jgi:hypothetical protein